MKTLTRTEVPAGISKEDTLLIPIVTEVVPKPVIAVGLLKKVPTPIEDAAPALNSRNLNTLFSLLRVIVVLLAETVVATLVRTSYCVDALYPEPVLPIVMAEIVPATDTVDVPPAETRG